MGWQPYWPSQMEVSYCTFRFGPTCPHYLITYMRAWLKSTQERQVTLNYKKFRRYNNSPLYVIARWPPQRIPPLNFFAYVIPKVCPFYFQVQLPFNKPTINYCSLSYLSLSIFHSLFRPNLYLAMMSGNGKVEDDLAWLVEHVTKNKDKSKRCIIYLPGHDACFKMYFFFFT